jgi:hypothetical protein
MRVCLPGSVVCISLTSCFPAPSGSVVISPLAFTLFMVGLQVQVAGIAPAELVTVSLLPSSKLTQDGIHITDCPLSHFEVQCWFIVIDILAGRYMQSLIRISIYLENSGLG